MDEIHVKAREKWTYLYQAIDKPDHTINFYLSSTRNNQAVKRFLGKTPKSVKPWEYPSTINTDKVPVYSAAIKELKTGKVSEQYYRS